MGLGQETPVEGLRGAYTAQPEVKGRERTVVTSEDNARGLYRRWAEFMDAESWDEIYPKNPRKYTDSFPK
jgi:hypothetical protein